VTEISAEADIRCQADTIFDMITDFGGQDRWLTRSSAYHGTMEVSTDPVALGTTYREPGPFGVRHGRVTEFAVIKSSGYPDLDAALESMMRGATLPPFPADMDQPSIDVSVTIRFSLEG